MYHTPLHWEFFGIRWGLINNNGLLIVAAECVFIPGGAGGTWVNFCWLCAVGLSELLNPIIFYSVANYRPHLSHFWTNIYSQLGHFLFFLIDHVLDWMKNTLLFIYNTNILVRLLTVNMKNCLTPKNPKMCDPILVTLLKMRPHYNHSSRENATPSSGTSPLACYKEVPYPPGFSF